MIRYIKSRTRDLQYLKRSIVTRKEYEKYISEQINQCDFDKNSPADSVSNLQNTITNDLESCVPTRKQITIRERGVSSKTKRVIEERSKNYSKMTPSAQKAASKAISNSSRNEYR